MKNLLPKLRTFAQAVRRIENWPTAVALRLRREDGGTHTLNFRNGLSVLCRSCTNDWEVVSELLLANGYARAFDYLRSLKGAPRVLDLGANIGLFSLRAAMENSGARVDAFEPAPLTIELLKKNLRANPRLAARVVLHECAVGGTARSSRFFFDESKPDSAGLCYEQKSSFVVQIESLSGIVATMGGSIALLKMDVEGAEFEIVKETPASVWNGIAAIAIELHPALDPSFQPEDLLECLRHRGYSVVREDLGRASYFLVRT